MDGLFSSDVVNLRGFFVNGVIRIVIILYEIMVIKSVVYNLVVFKWLISEKDK